MYGSQPPDVPPAPAPRISLEQIRSQLEAGLRDQPAFRVELCDVRVFPVSEAVHLSVGARMG